MTHVSWKVVVIVASLVVTGLAMTVQMVKLSGQIDDSLGSTEAAQNNQNCIVGLFFIIPESKFVIEPDDIAEQCPGITANQVEDFIDRGEDLRIRTLAEGPSYEQLNEDGRYKVRSFVPGVNGPAVYSDSGEILVETRRIFRNPNCMDFDNCTVDVEYEEFFVPAGASPEVEPVGYTAMRRTRPANVEDFDLLTGRFPPGSLDTGRLWVWHTILTVFDPETGEQLGAQHAVISEPFRVVP